MSAKLADIIVACPTHYDLLYVWISKVIQNYKIRTPLDRSKVTQEMNN